MFVTVKDCTKPKKDDLAKHEISAEHQRSTLLLNHQMDFVIVSVTANDHAKLAIIAQLQTVLTQPNHCLRTFIRGSLQDLDGEETVSRIHWFSETDGHCRRIVVDACVVTFSVLEICSV